MQHEVTIFKSINSHIPQYYEVETVLGRIKRGVNKELINKIRSEKNETKRDSLKKQLLWICFSGKFKKRLNNELIKHSGLICIDFDKFPNKQTLETWRARIKNDKFTFALFISPSGNGLKALIKVPICETNEEHNNRFEAIRNYYSNCSYFDETTKGVNRVCFESYDPNLIINKDSSTYHGIKERKIENKVSKNRLEHLIENNDDEIFRKLIVWFEGKYNLKKGARNENLFYLFSACRDYGINENSSIILVTNYASSNAEDYDTIKGDISSIVRSVFSRPSQNKKMELIPTVDYASPQDDSIVQNENMFYHDSDELNKIESSDKEKLPKEKEFWKWGTTNFKIDFLKLKKFLQENGYYRYELNEKDFIFVNVSENTIQELDVRHIKDFLLKCLEEWDKPEIYNMIAENTKIKKEYLNYLDPIRITWNKDTKDYGWVYFKNIAVKVSKSKIELIEYIDLDGFIWKTQKLDRDFLPKDFNEAKKCDFSGFIGNICKNNQERINSFRSAVGYLVHSYKSKSTVKAVIFNDEIIAEDAMGGTGKGLTVQIISTVKNVVIIPGADFNTGKDFAWQRINFDTDIVLIDDVEKNFKYKKLFTFLTDGWPISKKFQDEIFLPPEDSPKIAVNTNYILKGETDSYARRKFELELYPHYSKLHQPIDDFGREFISEWPEEEQNLCDNFLLHCLKYFLNNGLIKPTYVNLKYKKIILNTSEDFVAFAKDLLPNNTRYNKKDLYLYYKKEHGLSINDYPNQKAFTKWMEHWGEYIDFSFKNRAGSGGMFFIYGTGEYDWEDGEKKDKLIF